MTKKVLKVLEGVRPDAGHSGLIAHNGRCRRKTGAEIPIAVIHENTTVETFLANKMSDARLIAAFTKGPARRIVRSSASICYMPTFSSGVTHDTGAYWTAERRSQNCGNITSVDSRNMNDARAFAPATERNREPILQVLRTCLPEAGLVLEVASGTGEHVTHFALATHPGIAFQPSDPERAARASIDAWVDTAGLSNVRKAISLDAADENWPIDNADMIICINMIHIAPWAATVGLMQGAARILPAHGSLFLYGPYRRNGRHTAPSNEQFDEDLRRSNPDWGVRDLEAVTQLASANGFAGPRITEMPANNLSVVFHKRS